MLNKSKFCKFLYCSFRSVTGKHLFRGLFTWEVFPTGSVCLCGWAKADWISAGHIWAFKVSYRFDNYNDLVMDRERMRSSSFMCRKWSDLIKCRCANMWFSRNRWGYTPVGFPYRKEREQPEARCSQNIYCNIKHLEIIVGIWYCINKM